MIERASNSARISVQKLQPQIVKIDSNPFRIIE